MEEKNNYEDDQQVYEEENVDDYDDYDDYDDWDPEEEAKKEVTILDFNLANNLSERYLAMESRTHLDKLYRSGAGITIAYQDDPNRMEPISVEHIMNTSNGIGVWSPNNRIKILWRFRIDRVERYEPNCYYGFEAWYAVWLNNKTEPLLIMENELKKGDSLRRRLSVFSQAEIAIYKSAKRTNELLRMFLEMNAAVYTIPLHHGWLYFDQSWKFVTMNGKTHTRREELLGVLDIPLERRMAFLSIIGTASEMVQRYALEKAVAMMRTFRDPWVRKKLWLYLHTAAIFSLMKIQRIKLETGLCICSDSHKVQTCVEELFSWYGDQAVSLADDKQKVMDQMVLSKDQPLVLVDERTTKENEILVANAIQKDIIKHPNGKNKETYSLWALPVIISKGTSALSNCEKLNQVEIEKADITENALETIQELKPAFFEYLRDFMREVEENTALIQILREHIAHAIDQNWEEMGLNRSSIETIGVLTGVQELIAAYYRKLYNDEIPREIAAYVKEIDLNDYLELYQQGAGQANGNRDLHLQFLSEAQNLIQQGELKIVERKSEEDLFFLPENQQGEPFVFHEGEYVSFTASAFNRVCLSCRCDRKRMVKTLAAMNMLFGSKASPRSRMTRIWVRTGFVNRKQIDVYKLETWRIMGSPDNQNGGDGPYMLQLGSDSYDRIRTWNGGVNSHIRITGMSGTGKSYLLRYLAGQLPGQDVKCIIFDSTGDFSHQRGRQPQGWPAEGTKVLNMKEEPFELIPFTPQDEKETVADIASRISSTISVALGFGKRQTGHLTQRIADGLQSGALKEFRDLKELLRPDEKSSQSAKSVYSAMDGLWDAFPANAKPFDWEFDKSGITIINLHEAYSEAAEKIVVEMLLGELYSKRMRNSMTDMPHLVLVMDECQRLCWNENSFASKLMKESRKFGISVWAGTQTVGKKTLSQALGQCGLQIAFMPDGNSAASLAKELTGFNKVLINKCTMRLMGLERGQFLYVKNGEIVVASAP